MNIYEQGFSGPSILRGERDKIKRELRRMPKGRLLIQINRGKAEYYRVTYPEAGKRKRAWIGNDMISVYKLAHKAFLEEKLKRVEFNIKLLEKPENSWQPLSDQAILLALPKHFETLDFSAIVNTTYAGKKENRPNPCFDGTVPVRDAQLTIGNMDIDEWGSMPYCANTKYPEHLKHRTSFGLLCRSKGEAAIAELCRKLGFRFHYDETLFVCGRLCSPDFIIARADGSLVYLEHRGWKGESYERGNMNKDICYFNAGIRQGNNYLITFETEDGGIDLKLAEMQLCGIAERSIDAM